MAARRPVLQGCQRFSSSSSGERFGTLARGRIQEESARGMTVLSPASSRHGLEGAVSTGVSTWLRTAKSPYTRAGRQALEDEQVFVHRLGMAQAVRSEFESLDPRAQSAVMSMSDEEAKRVLTLVQKGLSPDLVNDVTRLSPAAQENIVGLNARDAARVLGMDRSVADRLLTLSGGTFSKLLAEAPEDQLTGLFDELREATPEESERIVRVAAYNWSRRSKEQKKAARKSAVEWMNAFARSFKPGMVKAIVDALWKDKNIPDMALEDLVEWLGDEFLNPKVKNLWEAWAELMEILESPDEERAARLTEALTKLFIHKVFLPYVLGKGAPGLPIFVRAVLEAYDRIRDSFEVEGAPRFGDEEKSAKEPGELR